MCINYNIFPWNKNNTELYGSAVRTFAVFRSRSIVYFNFLSYRFYVFCREPRLRSKEKDNPEKITTTNIPGNYSREMCVLFNWKLYVYYNTLLLFLNISVFFFFVIFWDCLLIFKTLTNKQPAGNRLLLALEHCSLNIPRVLNVINLPTIRFGSK